MSVEKSFGRGEQHPHGGVDTEHRRIQHEVVQPGVGRVDPEQALYEQRTGLVCFALPALGGLEIEFS